MMRTLLVLVLVAACQKGGSEEERLKKLEARLAEVERAPRAAEGEAKGAAAVDKAESGAAMPVIVGGTPAPVGSEATEKKLDLMLARLDAVEKKVNLLELARGGPERPSLDPIAPTPTPTQPTPVRAGQPDPAIVYAVDPGGSPYEGPEFAKITIIEASEFACPFCSRVRPTLAQLRKDYGGDLKIVYKHYIVHPQTATLPAMAACAANKQGKYPEMRDLLFDEAFAVRDFGQEMMEKLAGKLGLAMSRFREDMASDACKQEVARDQAALAAVGVRGTPAFFINGRHLSGAQPIDNFKKLIDEELRKADSALAGGMKLRDYYRRTVLEAGKKSI